MRRGHAADPATIRAPVPDVSLVIHDTEPDRISSLDGQFDLAFERLANRAQRRALTFRDGATSQRHQGRPPPGG